jgi:hypothetical protein
VVSRGHTVKNWREQGLVSYWQAPGSSKVLFFRDEVREFREKYTISKIGADKPRTEIKLVKPSEASRMQEWRI